MQTPDLMALADSAQQWFDLGDILDGIYLRRRGLRVPQPDGIPEMAGAINVLSHAGQAQMS